MTRGRVNIIKKQKQLIIILTVICLLIVANGIPVMSAPTPKPIPRPTMELVPTIVPAPTEMIASNQNKQITGVKVVPVNMGRMFLVSIIVMVGLKLKNYEVIK